ncbi:MAG: oligosaccharide flippase family protein [bacterium]
MSTPIAENLHTRITTTLLSRVERWLPSGSLRFRLAKGTFWSSASTVIMQLLALATSVVAARLLGKDGFGQLGIITSTVAVIGVLAGMGIATTATKYIAEYRIRSVGRLGSIIGLLQVLTLASTCVAAMGYYFLLPWLSTTVLSAPSLMSELRLSTLLIVFTAIQGAQQGILSGFERFRTIAVINVVRGALTFLLTLLFILQWQIWGSVLALVVTMLLVCVHGQIAILALARKEGVRIHYENLKQEISLLWQFALPSLITSLIPGVATWFSYAQLVNQPGGFGEMGIVNVTHQWRQALVFLPSLFGQVLLPAIAGLFAAGRMQEFKQTLMKSIALTCIFSILTALPIIALAYWIMGFYGPQFADMGAVLVLIALSTIFYSTAGIVGNGITSMGKMWHGMILSALWAMVFILFTRLLIHEGSLGFAKAYLFSYIAHTFFVALYVLIVWKSISTHHTEDLSHKGK